MTTTPNPPEGPDRKPEPPDDAAAPPPLPPFADPAQDSVQDTIPGTSGQPQSPFMPGSPYAQPGQPGPQQPQNQAAYGGGQYASGQYGGAQYGGTGQYQAAPPPPYGYGQPYGYPAGGMPTGMPPLATWGQRAAAFALDNGPAIVAGWVTGATRSNAVDVVFGIIGLVGLVWAVYNAIQAGRTGQSYGKRAMGIRLARFADGQPVGGGYGFLRLFLDWLFWVLCVLPGILNLLWPLWDARNQTWCDKIAKSVVVRVR